MTKSLARILATGLMAASASASALDLQKVSDVLQAPFIGSTKADLLQIQNGRIVATYARNLGGYTPEEEMAEKPPVTLENCRQLGIRQALLDISTSGVIFKEFSRSSSHRFGVVPQRSEAVQVFIAAKVFDPMTGTDQDRTYTYIGDDPSGGDCKLTETGAMIPGFIKKKAAEEMMVRTLQALPVDELNNVILKEGSTDWGVLADKSVKKVFSAECDQSTINIAISASVSEFKKAYNSEPVILFDFEQSRAWGVSDFAVDDHEAGMNGWWIVRMVSQDGTQALKTKVDFNVTYDSEKETCGGSITLPAQVIN